MLKLLRRLDLALARHENVYAALRYLGVVRNEPPPIRDHRFTEAVWMDRCAWLAHPQANRCNGRRRDHHA